MAEDFEIPGYSILEKIGAGSTSTVWRARQDSLDRDVAIKVLHPDLWTQMDEADAFVAEAHSVAQLRSRHIIQVYDTGRLENTAYIVLEYVAGNTVAQHLKENQKMAPREAMQIVAAIADALGDAWQTAGMIHRDIKPDNIIIEEDGSVKLADLGLARRADIETEDPDGTIIVGTPNYMSPEQAQGIAQVSPLSDMYSLGATLYHMLTGRVPFAGLSPEEVLDAQINKQLPWPQDIDPHIPLSYCQFIARLMMKNPEDRFADWNVVYHDAVKLAEGRMMMIKLPNDRQSTIARAGMIPTGNKKVIKIKKHHNPTPKIVPRRPAPKVPGWVQHTLNIGSFATVVLLLWFLLLQPMINTLDDSYQLSPDDPPPRRDEPIETDPTVADPPADEEARDDHEEDTDDAVVTDDRTTEPPLLRSEQVKKDLLTLLVQRDYEGAISFWEQNKQQLTSSLRRDLISEYLQPHNMPTAMIASALHRYTQRPTELEIGGETISVEIESIDNDTVEALRHIQTGTGTIMRPLSFRISLLNYEDQMRLLRETTNPYAPYAEVLIALQGADYETALQRASQMGPLQAVVEDFAQTRTDQLIQP